MLDIEIVVRLFFVILLVCANGFFVAAEFSLVAIRRSRVEQLLAEGNALARSVDDGVQHLDMYLAACQLGITIASIGLGWIGEPALAHIIEPLFAGLPGEIAFVSTHALSVTIAFSIITALHIVLGELAPKSLALQRTEATALAVALPLRIFLNVFRPAILLLNTMGNLVLRVFGLRAASAEEQVHSVEELRYLVAASREAGVLDDVESDIVHRAFKLGEMQAQEVMVPRTEITAVEKGTTVAGLLEIVAETGHSRMPVYEESLDNIAGVVHLRDIVQALRAPDQSSTPVEDLMRPALFLPDTVTVERVLLEMERNRIHLAILVDEHGGTAGLVTLENLVEVIVGELHDEFETGHRAIAEQPDGTVLIDGLLPIRELVDRFSIDLGEDDEDDFNTVGGLVMGRLGRIAERGDSVPLGRYNLRVEAMDGLRVTQVRLMRN